MKVHMLEVAKDVIRTTVEFAREVVSNPKTLKSASETTYMSVCVFLAVVLVVLSVLRSYERSQSHDGDAREWARHVEMAADDAKFMI